VLLLLETAASELQSQSTLEGAVTTYQGKRGNRRQTLTINRREELPSTLHSPPDLDKVMTRGKEGKVFGAICRVCQITTFLI
jgi:hypothetical protein